MKTNWQIKKLGEICEIKPPKNEARKKLKENELVSFVPMEDLGILSKELNLQKERTLKEVSGSYTYFADGDVLLAKITPCFENGKLGIARNLKNGIGFGSSEYIVFRPNENLLSEYLFYFLSDDSFRQEGKKSMSGAVGHKRVSKEFIENLEIPLPPLVEQKWIVKILDEVFEGIEKAKENAEKNFKNSQELFESYLHSVFANPGKDWKEKTLGETCDFYNGKAHEKVINENGAYIVINSKFVSSNGEKYKKTNKALFPLFNGDITMVMSDVPNGKTLAKCFVIERDNAYTLNQRICVIRSKVFETRFLYLQLNRHKYLLSFNNGENQTNLRKNDILNCPLFVPSLSEQNAIVKKLDALSEETKKLEAIFRRKIADLDELKKSILKSAFAGKL